MAKDNETFSDICHMLRPKDLAMNEVISLQSFAKYAIVCTGQGKTYCFHEQVPWISSLHAR
jgi:hypothetical protein